MQLVKPAIEISRNWQLPSAGLGFSSSEEPILHSSDSNAHIPPPGPVPIQPLNSKSHVSMITNPSTHPQSVTLVIVSVNVDGKCSGVAPGGYRRSQQVGQQQIVEIAIAPPSVTTFPPRVIQGNCMVWFRKARADPHRLQGICTFADSRC